MRLFLATAAISLLAAAPAAAVPTWLPPVTLSPQSVGEVQNSVIASDAAGHLAAVWMKQTSSGPLGYRAQLSVRSPGGSFSPVINVSPESEQTLSPDVGIDGSGTATVAWDETIGGVREIKVMRVSPAGEKSGVETLSTNAQGDPRVAVNADGIAVITWRESSAVHAALRLGATQSFTDVGPISGTAATAIDTDHDVVINAAGDAVAAWVRDGNVESNRRPAGGSFSAPGDATPIAGGGNANNLVLAMAPSGQATAMWARAVVPSQIWYAERTISPTFATGGWNPAGQASPAGKAASNPAIALDAQNSGIAVWENTTDGKIQAAIRPSGGSFPAVPQDLSGTAGGLFSQVAVAPDGSAVAIWRGASAGKPAIQAARRAPGGSFGAVTDIAIGDPAPADPVVDFFNASVAVDAEGNAAAVWSRFRNGTVVNDWRLDAAGFDAAPPAFAAVSVPPSGTVGAGIGMAAAATDRWSPFSLAWSFGDGTGAPGDAVTHAFGAAGPFNVTVTATDAVGNAASAARPVVIAALILPPPTPRINSPVSVFWAKNSTRIFLLRMKIRRVPRGGKAELRCRGRKCPFRRKSSTKRRKGAITLFKDMKAGKAVRVKNRTFRPGQRLQLRITAAGHIGKVVKYRLRRGRFPVGVQFCLPLGATKPQKRC